MRIAVDFPVPTPASKSVPRRSLSELLAPFDRLAATTDSFLAKPVGRFEEGGREYELPRYICAGNTGSGDPIRLGIFAGIHGDEPEGIGALAQLARLFVTRSELAVGYRLFLYPICNPTGVEDRTRHSRSGKDLNREFWSNSEQSEVQLLEAELRTQSFDGIICLHTDEHSNGLYAFARGSTLTKHLLRPALAAAAELLPVNQAAHIDGFHAREGLIEDCYEGVLSAPSTVRPKPFEIILETPGQGPLFLREAALVVAVRAILSEYRKFIAFAPNL